MVYYLGLTAPFECRHQFPIRMLPEVVSSCWDDGRGVSKALLSWRILQQQSWPGLWHLWEWTLREVCTVRVGPYLLCFSYFFSIFVSICWGSQPSFPFSFHFFLFLFPSPFLIFTLVNCESLAAITGLWSRLMFGVTAQCHPKQCGSDAAGGAPLPSSSHQGQRRAEGCGCCSFLPSMKPAFWSPGVLKVPEDFLARAIFCPSKFIIVQWYFSFIILSLIMEFFITFVQISVQLNSAVLSQVHHFHERREKSCLVCIFLIDWCIIVIFLLKYALSE